MSNFYCLECMEHGSLNIGYSQLHRKIVMNLLMQVGIAGRRQSNPSIFLENILLHFVKNDKS